MTIDLFEIIETIGQALANNLQKCLINMGWTKSIAYVKNERSNNLNTMTIV
jgi:hypothetical protein